MEDFRTWFGNHDQELNELLRAKAAADPMQWVKQKRLCKFCNGPVQAMGSTSDGNSRWAKCTNPKCPSQRNTLGFLEPDQTVGKRFSAIGLGF